MADFWTAFVFLISGSTVGLFVGGSGAAISGHFRLMFGVRAGINQTQNDSFRKAATSGQIKPIGPNFPMTSEKVMGPHGWMRGSLRRVRCFGPAAK